MKTSVTLTATQASNPTKAVPSPVAVLGAWAPQETLPYQASASFLGSNNEWRRDISQAPVVGNSAGVAANIANQVAVRWGGVAAFNWDRYNNAFYTVASGTQRVNFIWDNCQNKTYTPATLFGPNGTFVNVPMPADAIPSSGTDGALSVWDPSTDQLWEFWKAVKRSDGWHACWGGRIDGWSRSPGYFANGTGVSASGLAMAPGVVGIREMQTGQIDHAVALGLVDIAHWSTFSYPAQRSDGSQPVGTPDAVAEGQRLRLDPSINVDNLPLTPIAKAIARAAQRYGFIVVDKSGAVGVATESAAGLLSKGNANPWTSMMAGVPGYQIMRNFPWNRLQALPMNYGRP